jgi:hypothetical protein
VGPVASLRVGFARCRTDQLYFRRPGCDYGKKVHPHNSQGDIAERFDLAEFEETLAKFTKLKAFIHKPLALSAEPWVTDWQGIRLDTYTFDNAYDEDCRKDDDREAFHLSYALRALGWAKPSLTDFTSVTLHVEGPAFWGPHRLQRLWADKGHDKIRSLREISIDAVEADAHASMIPQIDTKIEEFTRQLVLMENAVQELSHVDCSVSDDEENGGLFTAARPLFEFLCCGSNLRKVRLAFGWMVDGDVLPELWTRERGDGPRELLTLLTRSSSWPKIKELELQLLVDTATLLTFLASLSATLRHLALHNVTLSDESWESALPAIVERLPKLTHLDLSRLCDRSHDQSLRVIFDSLEETWSGKDACFDDYRNMTVGRLLRKKPVQWIEPEAFLRAHQHVCRHT